MTKILPPGSTSADLQAAIDSATAGDTIVLSSNMPFSGVVEITAGKKITIQSSTGNNWVMSTPGASIRHFDVSGSLVLQSVMLDGGAVGGGIFVDGGSLEINDAVIQGCTEEIGGNGGALLANNGAEITMNSGKITGNTALSGGGMYLDSDSVFTMSGGEISNNTGTGQGGAAYVYEGSLFRMTGGYISGNTADDGLAGGLFVYRSKAEITGESYITNNRAQYGGAIYTLMDDYYTNLVIGSTVIFSCNSAKEAYSPPQDASTLYPNIQFASTSITDHVLNNFDIGPMFGETREETYHVTYNANGGTGNHAGPETAPGSTDTVLPVKDTGISRTGYTFAGWNTKRDGSGTAYAPGAPITVDCSVVLFAQWLAEPVLCDVIYSANGGTGSYTDSGRAFNLDYTILSANQTGISRKSFLFAGWNTKPDGSGKAYAPGNLIALTGDVQLYAQWRQYPGQQRLCRTPPTKSRTAIEGQKLWVDNDNAGDTRPPTVEILLLRDGEIYRRANVDSTGDGYFGFCCLPVCKNSGQKYIYRIDESAVARYTTTIDGFNVINTLIP